MQKIQFIKSSSKLEQCPAPEIAEFAFIGRSNVGKSSLINMIADKKDLAKTSSKPGKTQLINHFIVDDTWYLVDLPGYGYAKVAKSIRENWEEMTFNYLENRSNLKIIFVLIDSRHQPLKQDIEFINWLGTKKLDFILIFTKADKVKKQQLMENLTSYKNELESMWDELPFSIVSSSKTKMGKEQILQVIESLTD